MRSSGRSRHRSCDLTTRRRLSGYLSPIKGRRIAGARSGLPPNAPVSVRGSRPFRSFVVTSRQSKVSPSPTWSPSKPRSRDSGEHHRNRSVGRTPRPGSRSGSRALTNRWPNGSGRCQVTGSTLAISRGPGIVADRYDLIEESRRKVGGHVGGQGSALLGVRGNGTGHRPSRRHGRDPQDHPGQAERPPWRSAAGVA